ncbi:unnamed protein product [Echinostoma caproni]|uniref:SERPIN domain-containing protein n=1 Tax=Echinostoma caproni TaxID=27848 RepID=A0A183APB0_9TREM|nr:unnamed protein product [Echinostoma caproni]
MAFRPRYKSVYCGPQEQGLYLTMAMTSLGCSGKTKNDLLKALKLPEYRNEYEVHAATGALLNRGLQPSGYLHVHAAHRLFVLNRADVGTRYVKDVFKYYTAKWEDLSNMKDNDTKRRHINDWVGKMTQYNIQDLLPLSSITEDTIFTMVDALYVKGIWRDHFPKQCTTTAPFYRENGPAMVVKMMSTEGLYQIHELPEAKARMIKIPLGNPDWQYLIVVPNEVSGLRGVMSYLATGNHLIDLISTQNKLAFVRLNLPRFKVGDEPSMNIKRLLCSIGASSVFQKQGNEMSGICRHPSACMSDIFHKVVLEVNEDGNELIQSGAVPPTSPLGLPMVEFCVNRPFLLAVVYNERIPVFMGYIMSPNSR